MMWVLIACIFSLFSSGNREIQDRSDHLLSSALQAYQQGEGAESAEEGYLAFHRALELYQEVQEEVGSLRSPHLLYNIGNCYLRLDEPARAVHAYRQALHLSPRDHRIIGQLHAAQLAAGIEPVDWIDRGWFQWLSLGETVRWASLLVVLAGGIGSVAIWHRVRWLRRCSYFFTALSGLVLLLIVTHETLVPAEGVVVQGVLPRLEAEAESHAAYSAPVLSGTIVAIDGMSGDGAWLRVSTPSGGKGYIPREAVCLIDT